jgi:four helix bundle protein
MASFKSFEEIIAWQKARENTKLIYSLTRKNGFERDFDLKNQVRDSATSVMGNIAEGFDRDTDKEFARFLYIARSSNSETLSHLYVALDQEYINQMEFNTMKEKLSEVKKLINGLITYLQ